ncbi:potassium channel family protein [Aestuariivivens insulae]|uniref:potassium channel family protein n=1 Tax=Aestuariivivens insulae TaxID=1621988 RepID=UPI001F5ADB43|nr:potassium channel family protein [Aestuariivivens insulae]
MVSFFITLFRFAKVIYQGIRDDSEFRFLLIFIILLLTSSTLFYSNIENWAPIDSLYFSVMTMSTVGYGDFVPSTLISKIFTIIFTFLSIGAFVSFTAKMIGLTLGNRSSRIWKKERKAKKQSL